MQKLVKDFSVHPLLPGGLLTSLMELRDDRKRRPLGVHTLMGYNRHTSEELLSVYSADRIIDAETAEAIQRCDAAFVGQMEKLAARIPEIAEASGCQRASVHRLARAMYSSSLFVELLEILAPEDLSFEKTDDGAIDLVKKLGELFADIVGSVWAEFFPRSEISRAADASAQIWVSCLYERSPQGMARGFQGPYTRANRERLKALDRGLSGTRLPIKDRLTPYLKAVPEKLSRLHDAVRKSRRLGPDRLFLEISRITTRLELSPAVIYFYDYLVREVCDGFARLHDLHAPREGRFARYLYKQLETICQEHYEERAERLHGLGADDFEAVLRELDGLIGIRSAKEKVREIANFARLQMERSSRGMDAIPTSYHAVYTGNPGTGKTTVARIMGRAFKALGVLKKGHVVECDRSSLVAEHVGQTAAKTNKIIDEALDGILFIDEAYSLAKGGQDYGSEAIDTLVKRMEDDRDRLLVIVAGYPNEMATFISSNPGLRSRFNRTVEFPDFADRELCRIFGSLCRKHDLSLTPELKEKIVHHFRWITRNPTRDAGNGRMVRNAFEKVVHEQASRLSRSGIYDDEALSILEASDLESPADTAWRNYRKSGRGYVVECEQCKAIYDWDPAVERPVAQCGHCGQAFYSEFGILAAEPRGNRPG
ncbi:MAG: AAA family ATPase [Verrucomicrobiia bacterium]|jgi:stage V sporulation protein K